MKYNVMKDSYVGGKGARRIAGPLREPTMYRPKEKGLSSKRAKTVPRKKYTKKERSEIARVAAKARWAKKAAAPPARRHYKRRKGYHRHFYSLVEKKEFNRRGVELIRSGKAVHVTHAAQILGVSPGALNAWMKGQYGKVATGLEKQLGLPQENGHLTLSAAVEALDKVIPATATPTERRQFLLMFENALLRQMTGAK
jgi:hypothetical protein